MQTVIGTFAFPQLMLMMKKLDLRVCGVTLVDKNEFIVQKSNLTTRFV